MKKFIAIHLSELDTQAVEIHHGESLKDIITESFIENEDFCEILNLLGWDEDEDESLSPEEFYKKAIAYMRNSDGDEIFKIYDITSDEPREVMF